MMIPSSVIASRVRAQCSARSPPTSGTRLGEWGTTQPYDSPKAPPDVDVFIQNTGVTSVIGGKIDGVLIAQLEEWPDDRGRFIETWRAEWFPDKPPMVQNSRSDSRAGVIRALHFHRK